MDTPKCSIETPHQLATPTPAFLRLPAEILNQIYEYCLADRFVFEIVPAPEGNGHVFDTRRGRYPPWWPTSQHVRSRSEGYCRILHGTVQARLMVPYPRFHLKQDNYLLSVTQCTKIATMLVPGCWLSFMDPEARNPGDLMRRFNRYQDRAYEPWSGLSLLLTCRQIYLQAWRMLYGRNTFAFLWSQQFDHLNYFRHHTSSTSFSSIMFLHMAVPLAPPGSALQPCLHDRRIWKKGWETIAQHMTGLKELDLELMVARPPLTRWSTFSSLSYVGVDSTFNRFAPFPEWLEDVKVLPKLKYARVQAHGFDLMAHPPPVIFEAECRDLERYLSPNHQDSGLDIEARDKWLER